jgi:membrane-bound lytic murein transglycosylase B
MLLLVTGGCMGTPELPDGFQDWLQGVRQEALARHVSPATLDAALADLAPIPKVIELDRKQPETTMGFAEYLTRVLPERRVQTGRRLLEEHADLLAALQQRYGVQPRFIVALWGMETDFGRVTGGYPVIGALATLAHDGRRSAFFRQELLEALQILDEGHIGLREMTGSWAGAMGQVQFMPSSFRRFATDGDGDGRRDIWASTSDALASAANYLAGSGWRAEQGWGMEVRLPEGFDPALAGAERIRALAEWRALGLKAGDGTELAPGDLAAAVVQPGGPTGPAYLVYDNYRTLLKWNRSDYFAAAVGLLSDRLAAP